MSITKSNIHQIYENTTHNKSNTFRSMTLAEHLLNALKDHYNMEIDWTGRLNCGITHDWN